MNSPSIPHSIDAEEAVVGAILINPYILDDIALFLRPDDFYIHRLRWAYATMLELRQLGTPIDMLTVSEQMDKNGELEEAGGPAYLTALINQVPSSLNAESYARIVEAQSIRRSFINVANNIAALAYNQQESVNSFSAKVHKLIDSQARQVSVSNTITADIAAEALLHIVDNGAPMALQTYLPAIDAAIGGLPLGEVVLLAGDTSSGKTALTLQMAEQLSQQHKKILYVSMESKAHTLVARRVCSNAGIEQKRLRKGDLTKEEKEELRKWISQYRAKCQSLVFDDVSRDIASIERSIAHENPELVIVDHLGEMTSTNDNTTRGILENFSELKALAKKYDCAMVVIHTIAADDSKLEDDEVPSLNALGWAKDLRYKTDILLSLYATDFKLANGSEQRNLWVLKDREGERFSKINLYFYPKKQWFSDRIVV